MVRILIATALLIAAFSFNAFADDADVTVTVTVGTFDDIMYDAGAADLSFTITEANLDSGTATSSNPDDEIRWRSNYPSEITYDATTVGGLTLHVTVDGLPYNSGDVVESGSGNAQWGNTTGAQIDSYTVYGLSWATGEDDYAFDVTYTIAAS